MNIIVFPLAPEANIKVKKSLLFGPHTTPPGVRCPLFGLTKRVEKCTFKRPLPSKRLGDGSKPNSLKGSHCLQIRD